ncbi:GNAT family N-acetyltransferase [Natribacillus halophilus]|uniref:N-acetylglutamate synthase, GNAT family n=1 Tax=Natribacillus halophilus TaxID=549003 RepID=A0A1G8L158_9BACI|nr:GNAT family N-acetyltransferase [Natribacillus halophilus]SDI49363.1 N-acetylglutamate synthase, GNAT family [Natribacillus halophilus]
MIRQASNEDIEAIMAIASKAVQVMNAEGSDQWNESYPTVEHFLQDIEEHTLFVMENDQRTVGFITIDQDIPQRFEHLSWSYPDHEAGTFHRLAVDPAVRNIGVAAELIRFAEAKCQDEGLKAMKIDTYALNKKARHLFERLGYNLVGYSRGGTDRTQPFYYYEKVLTDEEAG